ncbi:MAG: hypothetical protein ACKKL6_03275 [Candidatus Komeilibacteria bacterium]
MNGFYIALIIIGSFALLGTGMFVMMAFPKIGSKLSAIIPSPDGATTRGRQTRSTVSTSVTDYLNANDFKSRFKIPMFLAFPVLAFFVWHYPVTFVIAKLGWWIPIILWVTLGLSGTFLVPFAAFEDDGGRKALNFAYKLLIVATIAVLLTSLFAPAEFDFIYFLKDAHPDYIAMMGK